jgi:hypothetical protein
LRLRARSVSIRRMLRFCLGLVVATSIVVSCAGDDDKRKVRGDEAGAGGESGAAPSPDAGGSSAGPGGEGGTASTVPGGEGGTPAGSAGMPLGGSNGVASGGEGGTSGASSDAGAAGAGGEPGWPSAFCPGGEYWSGEGGCYECLGSPQTVQLTCSQAFTAKDLLSDGEPITVRLSPNEYPREPLPTTVDVAFLTPNETHSCNLSFNYNSGQYEIDVTPGPNDPAEVIVQPFVVESACGDRFELLDTVRFLHSGGDDYVVTCPDQT